MDEFLNAMGMNVCNCIPGEFEIKQSENVIYVSLSYIDLTQNLNSRKLLNCTMWNFLEFSFAQFWQKIHESIGFTKLITK